MDQQANIIDIVQLKSNKWALKLDCGHMVTVISNDKPKVTHLAGPCPECWEANVKVVKT